MAKGTKYTNQPIGTFDGLRHYINPVTGMWVVSAKGGASDTHVKHSPVFARTRENYTEFGKCAAWTRQMRLAIFDLTHLCYGNYTAWINQLGKTIQKKDVEGLRGQRAIYSSRHKSLLTSLNFNEQHPFRKVLARDPEVFVSDDRATITVTIPKFYSDWELVWPQPFSSYRISLQIGQLSDIVWDKDYEKHTPQYPDVFGVRKVVKSEWLSKDYEPVDLVLTASFNEGHLPPADVTVMVALGIEIGKRATEDTISFTKGDGTMALIACI